MERRILAELFVEDEKAIETGKGTIDYAKDIIDYQCQECGISTGDMRILDDDDPEDGTECEFAEIATDIPSIDVPAVIRKPDVDE